ncbi:MAG: BTAD domain-containing putative transcriptional regulator [Ardenticatenia bacterium]|nr:BTAD domain-containing putative transcriptional regulator [Ardenticatenia bacterium]
MERARRLAFAGREEEAVELLLAIFEAGGRDEHVAALLAEWVATHTTGPRPHQLLGDVYQRMGRIHEALEQYRLALQKL